MWPVFLDYLSISYDYAGMYLFFEKGMRNGAPYFKNKYLNYVMIQNQNQSIVHNQTRIQFIWSCNVQISSNKWINPNDFVFNKQSSNNQKVMILKLVSNKLRNYMNYIRINLQLLIKQKSKKKCSEVAVQRRS